MNSRHRDRIRPLEYIIGGNIVTGLGCVLEEVENI